ncbi:related to DNA repair protein rad8 [Cephalotrichum gorgonifer]|uniref:Related to DNA repair protein rad8 n=1 Tax=Cephalotrichum gorgonifer TaxID=2041049 RepID=A0AAE8MQX8_9PEZI|nr:related to DNA repair protein rad8 [Cephalotrichum gorgonifer]
MPSSEPANLSIYAELLPSIRQVSVAASLPLEPGAATRAQVFADGTRIGIRHGSSAKDLLLPGTVEAAAMLPVPNSQTRSLSWRLPLAASYPSQGPLGRDHYPTPPWSSADLEPRSPVTCRHCGNCVLPANTISTWKDLPSENWAEMMEFWHCHKPEPEPDNPQTHDHLTGRGYGASAAISAQSAIGFVDITSFLFAEPDVTGLEYSDPTDKGVNGTTNGGRSQARPQRASCAQCHTTIGLLETHKQSVRLFKWQVNCRTLTPVKDPSAAECLAATLMATMSRSGSAKIMVMPISLAGAPTGGEKVLHLRILNSNIAYTSTEMAGAVRTAIKLLYQVISRSEADGLLDPMTSDIQDVSLVQEALKESIDCLEASNKLLPKEQRRHQDWNVARMTARTVAEADIRVDPAKYLPLGCIYLSQAVSGLSLAQFIALSSNHGWIPLETPRNQWSNGKPTTAESPLDPISDVQATLMMSCRALKPLKGLLQAHWIRLEVSANSDHGGLIIRVYVLPDDVERRMIDRGDFKLRNSLRSLLQRTLDFSKDIWAGTYPAEGTIRVSYPTRLNSLDGKEDGSSESLLSLFNTIPSPAPTPETVLDPEAHDAEYNLLESKVPGLTSTLYSYQRRSAAVMLEKEASLGRSVDPRLVAVLDQEGSTWYYDQSDGVVLKEPRYYDDIPGGILAEEMGSGKTIICLSLILATRHFYPLAPELYRGGSTPVRNSVGSLVDMVASNITRNSVPWVNYFESARTMYGLDFSGCIEAIKRNPGYYLCPEETPAPYRVTLRGRRSSPDNPNPKFRKIYLSRATVVVVPNNLVRQWLQEIRKHTSGLEVLTLESNGAEIPSVTQLLGYDIILFAQTRLEALQGTVSSTALADIHFKRCIVDEGHKLGNSKIRNKSNLLLVVESLRFSSRWIVTGTPAQGLIGVNGQDSVPDPTSIPVQSYISSKQETKDLERIGAMAALYLKARPWANSTAESGDTPADWAVYVMQPHHSAKSRGPSDCLRQTLNSLIVRHGVAEVGELLPPVEERVVVLDGSYQDRLSLNIFSMMIVLNSVQSQRTDRDYFFHPKQRRALMELVHNLRQSSFFGGSFFTASELRKSITTAEGFLAEGKVPMSEEDEVLLREAIAFGHVAVENEIRNLSNQFHEVPIHVAGFTGPAGEAWSLDSKDGSPILTDSSMMSALQRVVRRNIDSPTALNALLNGGLIEEGRSQRSKALESDNVQPTTARIENTRATVLAGNTKLGDSRRPRKHLPSLLAQTLETKTGSTTDKVDTVEDREIPPSLAQTRLIATSSAKLSYLLDSIAKYQEEEQIIVFYENENIAWYIAGMLDMLQIPHLIYAKSLTTARKAQYVNSFNHSPLFRVMLMDITQAAFGLDMRAASRIYFISPVLNPQVEAQAIGRARRISQQKPVSVETLVLRDSIEEVIVSRKQHMTQAEHRKCKSILDDRPIYNWILNARVSPLPAAGTDGASQMAPLEAPQLIFGKGFGHVKASDEGLMLGEPASPTAAKAGEGRTNGVKRAFPADLSANGDPAPSRRVRFADSSGDD